jgi:hypothetical protein
VPEQVITYPTPLPELWGLWCQSHSIYLTTLDESLGMHSLLVFETLDEARKAADKENGLNLGWNTHPARIKSRPEDCQP